MFSASRRIRDAGEGLCARPGLGAGPGLSPGPPVSLTPPFASLSSLLFPPPRLSPITQSSRGAGLPSPSAEAACPVLLSEVNVLNCPAALLATAEQALDCQPLQRYTFAQLQAALQRVFDTGYFARVLAQKAQDTRQGLVLEVRVEPNAPLSHVVVRGASRLPSGVAQAAFAEAVGPTLNLNRARRALERLDAWYAGQGLAGHVESVAYEAQKERLEVRVAETVVADVGVFFSRKAKNEGKGGDEEEDGGEESGKGRGSTAALDHVSASASSASASSSDATLSLTGRSQPETVLRQLGSAPGRVYSPLQASEDLNCLMGTGLFDDAWIEERPAPGSTRARPLVSLAYCVAERPPGSLGAGGGLSTHGNARSGVVGRFSASRANLWGRGQRLSADVDVGLQDSSFRLSHVDPWVWGDAHRTSRSILIQKSQGSLAHVSGGLGDRRQAILHPASPQLPASASSPTRLQALRERSMRLLPFRAQRRRVRDQLGRGMYSVVGRESCLRVDELDSSRDGHGSDAASPGYGSDAASPGRGSETASPNRGCDSASPSAAPPLEPCVSKITALVEWTRPLTQALHGAAGLSFTRSSAVDGQSRLLLRDALDGPIAFSASGTDTLALASLSLGGSLPDGDARFFLSAEQALPLQPGWLNMHRLTARADTSWGIGRGAR